MIAKPSLTPISDLIPTPSKTLIEYEDGTARQFMAAALFWGIIGMTVVVLIALQLGFWQANMGTSWLTFGRLRPLHTNAVIFAFLGNMYTGRSAAFGMK